MKAFPIADVLSVTTGRLHGEMGGIYQILSHMTGDTIHTHQIPRALKVCGPALRAIHPDLPADGFHPDMLAPGLTAMVPKLAAGVWESREPLAELVGMVGPERVLVASVQPPEGGGS